MTSGRVTVYFAALLARTEDGWEASDTELDDVETLSDLTDLAREASVDEDTVLVFIEQEDAWFGVVRVDGEDDPRIFISDATAAARSSYGEILLTDELLGREPGAEDTIAALEELVGLDDTEDGDPDTTPDNNTTATDDDDDDDGLDADAVPAGPLGDTRILADLGLPEAELLMLRTDALVEIADALGAAEVLETVR
ncbi:putative tRNA adenosine deaminase-associated protein [Streptomyces sp. TE3672]